MHYNEYRVLKRLYDLSPTMRDDQTYPQHFMSEIQSKHLTEKYILGTLHYCPKEYVTLLFGGPLGKTIHTASITVQGVYAVEHYYWDVILNFIKSMLVPAIVSALVSFLFSVYTS